MRRIVLAIALILISTTASFAQSSCPYIANGAVLTAAQWQACFQAKNNTLGYTPVNRAGDVMQGRLVTVAPGTTAGLNLVPGSAPVSPANGDLWMTSAGLYGQVNGVTVGPLGHSRT